MDRASNIVKAVELIHGWCTLCNVTLKSLNVLGSTYCLMSSAQLDSFCQWVYVVRRLFSCKEDFSINRIVECGDQTSSRSDTMVEEVDIESPSTIAYWPVCAEWQKYRCQLLGVTFLRGNIGHILKPVEFSISHQPAKTVRIRGDGHCSFKALALIITGSQDEYHEFRAITTSSSSILSC